MTVSILRTAEAWWVHTASGAARIAIDADTTAELLAQPEAIYEAAHASDTVQVDKLRLVSPLTTPCRVVAQATNFASHVEDVGRDPKATPLTFFRKASGSVSGPFDDIVKPAHVQLLDYEVEIGLVIGRDMPVGTEVNEDNLADYVCALVVTNDVSARDVQLTKAQFYESKSYPTFTPVGPALVLVDADELKRFGDLRLQLRVNGQLRQNAIVEGDMLFTPLQALQNLAQFQRLEPGDLVLTGTPVGTALTVPKGAGAGSSALSAEEMLKMFLASQADNPNYLHDGDVVEATIATDDGAIELGVQRTVVRFQ
jgi:2-keto-4-pentenoate hydratase/2-oxohepta-3-ene-1,7-dioic acid hydratase in catechol pathway